MTNRRIISIFLVTLTGILLSATKDVRASAALTQTDEAEFWERELSMSSKAAKVAKAKKSKGKKSKGKKALRQLSELTNEAEFWERELSMSSKAAKVAKAKKSKGKKSKGKKGVRAMTEESQV